LSGPEKKGENQSHSERYETHPEPSFSSARPDVFFSRFPAQLPAVILRAGFADPIFGDPLRMFLFDLVDDVLIRMVQEENEISFHRPAAKRTPIGRGFHFF